jgi:hypothetical protein
MNSKYILIITLTAFVIVGLYHIFAVGRYNYPEFRLREGQVADTEVIAPFDFSVLKSPEQLSLEQEQSVQSLPTPYRIYDEPLFDALSAIDQIWAIFYSNPDMNSGALASEFDKAGFKITPEALVFAAEQGKRDEVYESLRAAITDVYTKGIYADISGEEISFWNLNSESRRPLSDFYSIDEALASLRESVPPATLLIDSMKAKLIKANILKDEETLAELSQRKLSQIPDTEGVVLQNEIIIRKNARISKGDIEKLESLQAAYRNRNVQKSAVQQMLLAFGLLIYVFVILILANHYYRLFNHDLREHIADYLPINLGFILSVLFAVLSNHVLGLNGLLIPFALTVISAAILIGAEFGILYAVTSALIITPFIHWETYTPVIFILSTIITIILIKRQKAQHEFLSIWFYLLISGSVVSLALSIYKSDPINIVFRNIGFGMISSSISIMGILMLVPYYEKKWNRATKPCWNCWISTIRF